MPRPKRSKPRKGDFFESRRTGSFKRVVGYTRVDGVERVKLEDDETGIITKSKLSSLFANYLPA